MASEFLKSIMNGKMSSEGDWHPTMEDNGSMNRLRAVLDGELPAVAVSFENAGDVEPDTLARQAMTAGVDIAELRIDRFPNHTLEAVLGYINHFRGLPTVATIRSTEEGGGWTDSENERKELFRSILPAVDGVDIELSAQEIAAEVVSFAKAANKVVVVSYHNFENTPGREALEDLLREALALGADYVKISAMAKTPSDVKELAGFLLDNQSQPLIVIAMGALGTMSRVFFPALGSRMTFSFIGETVAPGQLNFEETFHLLRKFYPAYNNKKIIELEIFDSV